MKLRRGFGEAPGERHQQGRRVALAALQRPVRGVVSACTSAKPAARASSSASADGRRGRRPGRPPAPPARRPTALCPPGSAGRGSSVITRWAVRTAVGKWARSSNRSMPETMEAPRNATAPPAVPPAAPAPAAGQAHRAGGRCTQRLSACSSSWTSAGPAPFCGPNTAAAPRSPVSGLSTSLATTTSTSRKPRVEAGCRSCVAGAGRRPPGAGHDRRRRESRTPNARAIPVPPSVVALRRRRVRPG